MSGILGGEFGGASWVDGVLDGVSVDGVSGRGPQGYSGPVEAKVWRKSWRFWESNTFSEAGKTDSASDVNIN